MGREELVPPGKETGKSISIQCAHRGTLVYPLAAVQVSVGGKLFSVEAAVSPNMSSPFKVHFSDSYCSGFAINAEA